MQPFESSELGSLSERMLFDIQRPFMAHMAQSYKPIVEVQKKLHGNNGHYLVGDKIFTPSMYAVTAHAICSVGFAPLDPSLKSHHDKWYAEYQEEEKQWIKVVQLFNTILMRANSWQDVRDMLPDYVIRPYLTSETGLQKLARTRPDLYDDDPQVALLHWSPQLVSMYSRIGPTIDKYLGYKLL